MPSTRRIVAMVVVLLLLTGLGLGGQWLWHNSFFEEMGSTGFFIVISLVLGLIPVLGVLRPRRHRGLVVMWCRRFGDIKTSAGARNLWMWSLVLEACKGAAFPVTLQDSSIPGSRAVRRSLETPLSIMGLVLGIPLWLVLFLWIDERVESNWLKGFVLLASLALYIGMLIGIGRLSDWLTTSFASVRGHPTAMQRMLRTIKRRLWTSLEMQVVRCTNADWQDNVEAILDVADLVIIDCTESTEHISWEIELADERLGNDCVLLFSSMEPQTVNGLPDRCIEYNPQRAHEEIKGLSQEWAEDDYSKDRLLLGPYGQELASRLRLWIQGYKVGPKQRRSSAKA